MKSNRCLIFTVLFLLAFFNLISCINDTTFVCAIDSSNLVGQWTFDDGSGSTLTDVSGKGYDGIIHNADWIPGISGTALHFNGIDSYVEIPDSDDYNALEELSVSFWFKTETAAVWTPIINKGYTNEGTTDVFEINIDYGEKVSFTLNFNTSGRKTYTTPQGSATTNTWHHFAGVFDGDYLYLYIDGDLVAEHDVYDEQLKTSDAPIFIGIEYESPDETFFEGSVDEVDIFTRTLNANEVKELFNIEKSNAQSGVIDNTNEDIGFKSNNAIEKSPLNGILQKEVVPIAATLISITTLVLWQLFGGIIIDFLSDHISEKLIDAKGTRKKYFKKMDKIKIPKIPLKTSELFIIFIASFVFSFALSWTWGSSAEEIISLFILNFFIIVFVYIVRGFLRVYYSKKLDLETDHVLWPFGTLITIISSLLGNTFSLASYNTAENESDGRYATLLLKSTGILYSIALVCYLINFIIPSIIFQMVFIFIIMSLMIDMTPIKPMDGDIIRKWNIGSFSATYVVIIISYILMMFTIL